MHLLFLHITSSTSSANFYKTQSVLGVAVFLSHTDARWAFTVCGRQPLDSEQNTEDKNTATTTTNLE